jgi:hypothetical protein
MLGAGHVETGGVRVYVEDFDMAGNNADGVLSTAVSPPQMGPYRRPPLLRAEDAVSSIPQPRHNIPVVIKPLIN